MAKAPSAKKAVSSTNGASGSSTTSALEQVQALQSALLSSSDLNPLSDLLTLSKKLVRVGSDRSSKEKKDAAVALHRAALVLVRAMKSLSSENRIPFDKDVDQDGYILSYGAKAGNKVDNGTSAKAKEAQNKVEDWIRMRWNETIELLCGLLGHEVEGLRLEALQMLFELQTAASSSLSRITAAASAARDQARAASSSSKKDAAPSESLPITALWSLSPWRALTLALIAGPPSLSKLGSGEAGTRHKVVRVDSGIHEDVRSKFLENGLEEYDDVRFATLREISLALRKPSPSIAGNTQLRAHTLALLIRLTAIPTSAGDLNNFLVDELSKSPSGGIGSKKKKKSKAAGGITNGKKVVDDGDSEAEEEDEDDMAGWFSDSGDEGEVRAGATSDEQRRAAEKKSVGGLGSAARSASASKRRQRTFHEALHHIGAQRSAFSTAWLDLLLPRRQTEESAAAAGVPKGSLVGGELSLAATHEVLVRLHAQILPHLTKPSMLHDFLVSCLDSRGATALLALNAIFTLVTKHNLDYPQFYTRLYAMLDASVLHMKYRARFLRLLETFLSSTHLSSTLVASFAKRLSRLSLRAPPAAIASVVPFVYNLLKRHPRCMSMVHREWDGDRLNIGPSGVADPFDADETDPLKTNALESSLWELASFGAAAVAKGNSGGPAVDTDDVAPGEAHYLGSVTSLAKILAEPFTRERYSLDDFLDITYGTLFETETKKTLRSAEGRQRFAPALAYSLPGGFGAGGSSDSTAANRVDIFPSESGRVRAQQSLRAAEQEEEAEVEREREERKRKLGLTDGEEDEDEDEKEAREAIEELKREERAKKRKVDQTGTHDVCARLFSFA